MYADVEFADVRCSFWFYSKDEETDFNADIAINLSSMRLNYWQTPKLMKRTLRNKAIAVLLNYLSSFTRSLKYY